LFTFCSGFLYFENEDKLIFRQKGTLLGGGGGIPPVGIPPGGWKRGLGPSCLYVNYKHIHAVTPGLTPQKLQLYFWNMKYLK
jgi:hypothetical protein